VLVIGMVVSSGVAAGCVLIRFGGSVGTEIGGPPPPLVILVGKAAGGVCSIGFFSTVGVCLGVSVGFQSGRLVSGS